LADAPKSIIARVRSELMTRAGPRRAAARTGKTAAEVPLDTFVELLYEEGSAYRLAQRIGVAQTNVVQRRKWIEQQLGVELPRGRPEVWRKEAEESHLDIEIIDGTAIVGSDLHAWPELYGTAMAAYIDFHARLKPTWSFLNGDGLDGAKISRWPRDRWTSPPKVKDELDALRDYGERVRRASPDTKRRRTRGNHDDRFDNYFSSNAAEMEGVQGTRLADHLPGWDECMSINVNGNCLIQHALRSGVHAIYNNVKELGCHSVTGHRHKAEVRAVTNQMGTWYGVDSGMLAPAWHPCFAYTRMKRPTEYRSAFAVLTWCGGKLMPPELALVTNEDNGEVYFRGQVLKYEL
jgi:hypothetical protein